MRIAKISLLALSVLAIVLVGCLWLWPAGLEPVPSVESAAIGETGRAPDNNGKALPDRRRVHNKGEDTALARPLDGAATFAALAARLTSTSVSAGQRLEYLRQAAILCENVREASAGPRAATQSESQLPSASANFARDYYRSFCSDFTGSSDGFSSMGLGEESAGDVGDALQLWEVGPSGEAISLAEDLLLSTEDPSAMLAASAYVGSRGLDEWEIEKPTAAERSMLPGAKAEARALAARLLACESSGGCGPNGHLSVIECENVGLCRPGISAEQVWRERHSPAVYAYAEKLRDRLRELRAQKGG